MTDFTTTAQAGLALANARSVAFARPAVPAGGVRSFEAAQAAAVDFEAQFLSQMMAPMFENLGAAEPFGGGFAEEAWRSMQVQQYGKELAAGGGIGLAAPVLDQLLAMQAQEAQ